AAAELGAETHSGTARDTPPLGGARSQVAEALGLYPASPPCPARDSKSEIRNPKSHRPLHSRPARERRAGAVTRGRQDNADSPGDARSHRPAADARGS